MPANINIEKSAEYRPLRFAFELPQATCLSRAKIVPGFCALVNGFLCTRRHIDGQSALLAPETLAMCLGIESAKAKAASERGQSESE